MRADYLAFCAALGVNPTDVSASTGAHVANFYKNRTKNFKLGLSTSKHIPAQMTLYLKKLGCSGLWSTGQNCMIVPVQDAHASQYQARLIGSKSGSTLFFRIFS